MSDHPKTDRCGFDRNRSVSEDRYCCECGWPFDVPPAPDDLVKRLREQLERIALSDSAAEPMLQIHTREAAAIIHQHSHIQALARRVAELERDRDVQLEVGKLQAERIAELKQRAKRNEQDAARLREALRKSAETHHGLSSEGKHDFHASFMTCPERECMSAMEALRETEAK